MTNIITDMFDKIYYMWPFMGIFVFVLAYFLDRKEFVIKLDSVAKFMAFMFTIMLIKICIWNGQMVPSHYKIASMQGFLFVFLEDAFFVMLPYYICKKLNNKYAKLIVWLFFSILFGYGHIYLGVVWACITLLYPYFISYNYAKKSTFATVMVCHFVYDCLIFLLPKINNLVAIF